MGKITRVSGPVVIAEELEGARMYDVVRVGDLELVGEIIKLSEGKVTVQVYEDTSGIRPGEKIETTGRPLSVELGPGLLKSIYDGIQRPLDVIREQTGDFIRRGYTSPPLDEEKKWHFTATVKAGADVKEGQIIGEVQETGIIKHKVMVPFGKFGKIKSIKDGDYKISEPFAILTDTSGEDIPLRLKTEWPVRVSRRVLRKFPPEIPLITGQRVIDTFFPVAKGGTVAVPGPFGSGKCVTGETPVLMGDGSQVKIEDLFHNHYSSGKVLDKGNETYIELEEPLELWSLVDGSLVSSRSSLLYKGKSDTVIRVRTETGREVRVTPEHKLFRYGRSGEVIETRARLLSPGDSILSVGDEEAAAYRSDEGKKMETGASSLLMEAPPLKKVFPDRIASAEVEYGPFDVYDLSVPDYGRNFVGGHGGIILHNTVVQHQLSKWADSDIVVYVGCGERGNEMTEILTTFPELQDPRSGRPLMERTVLIANTSNMPVAAREASIYTGITIAEYYRDMGYNVALMADSTSRWAEALREISGRLEEMPGEEGYPAYLGRRLSEFYERSGNALVVSDQERQGSITIVGAVSPPGGDVSEPVSQNTLRVTRVFWALDSSLASRRHFPSINWLNSYSLYEGTLKEWYDNNISKEFSTLHSEAMGILQKESELQEVVQLVGYDALPEKEKAVLDVARMIREDFLQQSAFDEVDTYCSMKKQHLMLDAIINLGRKQSESVDRGFTMNAIQRLQVRQKISRMKEVRDDDFEKYHKEVMEDMNTQFSNLLEVQ